MPRIRNVIVVLALLMFPLASSVAEVSIGIGINLPAYPRLVRVPGHPVYYAPRVQANFFFLRRDVLGVCGRRLVGEFLVQRPLAAREPGGRAGVHPASPRALLPPASPAFSRMAA